MNKILSTIAAVVALSVSAFADPSGTWNTEEGNSGGYAVVTIAPCASDASKFCGTIVNIVNNDNTSSIGATIIKDMEDKGNGKYSGGQIWAPDEDKWYKAKMKLNSNGTLTVSGCVLGGVICRDQEWTAA